MMNPSTTFTRASQPPLRGIRCRYAGKSASRKNGEASPAANVIMPSAGWMPPRCTELASRVPMNGPTQAKDVSEKVRPISKRPERAAALRCLIHLGQQRGGKSNLERAEQAQSEHDEHERDEPIHPRIRSSCTTPKGPSTAVTSSPIAVNMKTMPRQKRMACRRAPGLFRKNDSVIGIIGNTQGVKMAARPKPKARRRKAGEILIGTGVWWGGRGNAGLRWPVNSV